ncbi:hypothetical protein EDB85DRAFT_1552510 [Lactarius pseudohatsudake]|nr:hypothetical protein EDB85DRAFT_1552510 [Lactarius pseudohatsudake]
MGRFPDDNMSIPHFTESIFLPHSWLEPGRMILETFFYYLPRTSKVPHQSGDAIHAAKYLRHLRDQPRVPRHAVTAFLVEALAFQAELEAENVMQDTVEMVVLCRELLTLGVDTTRSIALIVRTVLSGIHPVGPRPTIGSSHRVACERREAQRISVRGSLRPRLLSWDPLF